MKKLIALLLALVMALSMMACGAKEEAPAEKPAEKPAETEEAPAETPEEAPEEAPAEGQTIRVSGIPGVVSTELRALGDAFQEKNPGVSVEVVEFDEATYQSQATRIFTAEENNLDVAWFYRNVFWDDFVDAGVYEPLNDIYEQEDMVNGFGQAISDLYATDGTYYGIPFTFVWIDNLFYNTKLMEENGWTIPTTWEEMETLAAAIKEKGLIPVTIAAKDTYGEHQAILMTIRQFAADAYQTISHPGQTEIKFDDERWMAVWNGLADLQANIVQDGAAAADSNVARSLFLQGQSVMYSDGSWAANQIADEAPEGFEFSYTMWPAVHEDIPAKVPTFAGNMMAALSMSKNKDLAKQFVAFCGSKEGQEIIATVCGDAPARSDISDEAKESLGEIYAMMYDDMATKGADLMFTMLYDPEFVKTLNQVTQGVLAGTMGAEEACSTMQAVYDSLYA